MALHIPHVDISVITQRRAAECRNTVDNIGVVDKRGNLLRGRHPQLQRQFLFAQQRVADSDLHVAVTAVE